LIGFADPLAKQPLWGAALGDASQRKRLVSRTITSLHLKGLRA